MINSLFRTFALLNELNIISAFQKNTFSKKCLNTEKIEVR